VRLLIAAVIDSELQPAHFNVCTRRINASHKLAPPLYVEKILSYCGKKAAQNSRFFSGLI